MRTQFSKLALVAGILLALALTFSCSGDGGGSEQSYEYCITANKTCLTGPFTASTCTGQLSNSCPNGSSPSVGGSSSSRTGISSSGVNKGSSSSVKSSSSIQTGIIRGTPVIYEGETYNTVVIGTQTWMARNLNYDVEGSKCVDEEIRKLTDENTSYCDTYGRLYDWSTAMDIDTRYNEEEWGGSDVKHRGICPSGWHIPSNDDWDELINYVEYDIGCNSCAGIYLHATSGWNDGSGNDSGYGIDDYGFSALPGGGGHSSGNFSDVGDLGIWWSATESSADSAYFQLIGYHRYLYYVSNPSFPKYSGLFSVRCVKD